MGRAAEHHRRRRRSGNLLVAAQFALIGLCLLPVGPSIGGGQLRPLGLLLLGAGALVGGAALLAMGRDVRVHPVPGSETRLHVGGVYSVVRHPMYAAVLLCCAGVTVSTGRVLSMLALAGLVVVLNVKGSFEDRMLAERFGAEFTEYARRVPSLLPLPRPRGRRGQPPAQLP